MLATVIDHAPALFFRSASRSHPGLRRALNEDRVLERPASGFWAVADGMGGHARGDVAASRLVEALEAVQHGASGYARVADVVGAVEAVNRALFAEGAFRPTGATLVALLAHERHYACLWAGDSRAYHLRGGLLSALTRDHSHVQELVDAGALAEADRRSHPQAHFVTRAVGAAPAVELERRYDSVEAGDLFVLCSDGLTACLEERELAAALAPGDLEGSADRLLAQALDRGAPDNVSLVLVRADPA